MTAVAAPLAGFGFELEHGEWRYLLHEPTDGGTWSSSACHPDESIDMRDGWYRPGFPTAADAIASFPTELRPAFERALSLR